MKLQLQDVSDREFELMHEAILQLLSEFGVLFEDEPARTLLIQAGISVDDNGRVHLSPQFVESTLGQVPRDGFTMYGRDESRTLRVAVDAMSFRPSTGAPFILDYSTKRRREATAEDARRMILLTDALEGYDMVHAVVSPRDVPGSRGNVRLFAMSHRYSLKPSDVTVMTAREVAAIAKICSAIRGGERQLREKPLTAIDVAMITPLRCTGEQTQAFIECAKRGLPVEVLTSPAMGVTAPVTLAGSVAVALAEVVAGLCLVYLIHPGLGIINTARVSPTNMHTTAYNYGAPELGMGSVLAAACSARYHIPSNLYGFGTVAELPGGQASTEKIFSALPLALGRAHMITGGGILANALVTSPEQLVIDDEAIRFLRRICKPIAIDEESLAVDVFINAMRDEGTLLADEHTLKHVRAGDLLDAGLGQWASPTDGEKQGFPDLVDRAHAKVEQILASHSVAPWDQRLEKEIDGIINECEL